MGLEVIEEGPGFLYPLSSPRRCRICLEEDEEQVVVELEWSSATMEAPCACSGTLKFAHRGCIQRWCDEKGSTLCEICQQSFRAGYTAASRKEVVDVDVTIREDLDASERGSRESPTSRFNVSPWDAETNGFTAQANAEPSTASAMAFGRTAKCIHSIAMTFTTILLVKNFISVMSLGAQYHAMTLFVIFGLRASGVLLPVILILKSITAVQNLQFKHQKQQQRLHENELLLPVPEDETAHQQHHVIQVNC